MKFAIFSDIHGNLLALKAILADIKKENIDNIIFLGDAIGIGPNPKECLDLLLKNNVEIVLGNHELYFIYGTQINHTIDEAEDKHHKWIAQQLTLEQKEFLKTRPLFLTKTVLGKVVRFQHFLISNNSPAVYPFAEFSAVENERLNELVKTNFADIIFVGHQHKPFTVKSGSTVVYDAGTSGCVKTNKTHYVILTDENGELEYSKKEVEFNYNQLIDVIKETDYPEKELILKIFFGYDLKGNQNGN